LFEHEESILARAGHQMLSGREEKVEQGNRERARIKGGGKKKKNTTRHGLSIPITLQA